MRIEITEADIENAKTYYNKSYSRARFCPIAIAAKRAFGINSITVHETIFRLEQSKFYMLISSDFKCYYYWLPEIAANKAKEFDMSLSMTPFSFEIEV